MYDYVIVGAGSAGCVLAARLSEDQGARVLLLEAGGSDGALFIRGPGLYYMLWRGRHDWAFSTEPQGAVGERRMFWPRGKVLGGSSSLNAMIYIRGHRSNYDEWRDAGNAGWGYDDVLPLFKKSENWQGAPSSYHGTGGPLDVRDLTPAEGAQACAEAIRKRCGVPANDDFNGAEQTGAGRYQYTLRDGRRWSAADAFLHPARGRPNLEVRTGAHALGLVVNGGRVEGVRYLAGAKEETARASREVILCAGAIGSPHLMLVSGIGPAEHLRSVGVPVVHELPGVGENLQDHLLMNTQLAMRSGVSAYTILRSLGWIAKYVMTKGGPLAHPPVHTGGFVPTRAGAARPDLQIHVLPWGGFTPNFDEKRNPDTGSNLSVLATLIYPKSRGTIRLRSKDPLAAPAIDPRYLTDADGADLRTLIDGVKLAREIAATAPLAALVGAEAAPGPAATTDAAIGEEIRRRCNTIFHPVGTCKMGNDDLAVVDATLRVRGLTGLRVVDGAIMPTIVGGNTHAPIVMIAEKAAELIRGS